MAVNQSTEIWKPVVGYEHLYEVSRNGEVRRSGPGPGAHVGRHLKPDIDHGGYLRVRLSSGKQKMRGHFVHRLVLEAFVGPRPEGMICCHNDDNPQNNQVENLRWDTHSENIRDIYRRGRSWWDLRTECNYGHLLIDPNLAEWVKRARGGRQCKACDRAKAYAKARNLPFDQAVADQKYRDVMAGFKQRPGRRSK